MVTSRRRVGTSFLFERLKLVPQGGQAAATLVAVKHARRDEWRREKLTGLVARFRAGVQRHGLQAITSDSPIQPILCGDDASAMAMSSALESAGYLVTAIRPPTVPEGKARLRVTLSALHMAAEVDALINQQTVAGHRYAGAMLPTIDTEDFAEA